MKLVHRMRLSIRHRAGPVVLRSDVAPLGSPSQVSVALNELQRNGELIRLGVGVYAKARREEQTGVVRPEADFETLTREVARKLKLGGGKKTAAQGDDAPLAGEAGQPLVLDTGRRRVSRRLSLGGHRVTYVNDRTRASQRLRSIGKLKGKIPTTGVGEYVRSLAKRFNISYTPTYMDRFAETVTRLAGDEVRTGAVQDLLVALKRAGTISSADMATLLVNYLREQKERVRSI
ncbi:hypothetical protein [Stenotrophomonas geniculata]|uniref:hypothetical protein n=1 Tax=Stenotrophomonas geniculata TaxID=86188 RepID=UPI003D2E2315